LLPIFVKPCAKNAKGIIQSSVNILKKHIDQYHCSMSDISFHGSSIFIQFHLISPASSHSTFAETKGDLPPMRLLSLSCCRQQGDTAQLAPRRGSAAQNSRDLRPAKASGF
jgi:hypothetical protein